MKSLNEYLNENEYTIKNGSLEISTLKPNEAEYICKQLNSIGIECEYTYTKGMYYQFIHINNIKPLDKNKIEKILSNCLDTKIKVS